ncbi:hypothetical protein [Occultella gossypii]|uniref:Uncharacterized protein n=1 Tax=Occultella gossypii TaxID=2800820 RepID=A0ABS7SBY8_9MICO|nr:hypothetical protein [Occultella gossypii]MBZ2197260.1 hypothetical protein [Occultella gossypii]
MASKIEIDRLAHMANALRPDWPIRSLVTYLAREHVARGYQDLAKAIAHIATDPATSTPARLGESGPWWPTLGTTSPVIGPGRARCDQYGHEHYPAHNCPGCRTDALTGVRLPAPLPEDYTDAKTAAAEGDR